MSVTDVGARVENPRPAEPGAASPRPHHVILLIFGVLLSMTGLALTGAAAALGAAVFQQRDGNFITSPVERYSVDSFAITSEQLEVLVDRGLPPAGRTGPVASVMLRATSAAPDRDIFVGVGPQADVTTYLADVEHSELTQLRFNPFQVGYRTVAGSAEPALPGAQDFWAVSAQGPGTQQIESDLRSGNWVVVVMNADGSRPVAVDLQAGIRSRFLAPITLSTLITGLVLLAVGIPMVVAGAAGLGRSATPTGGAPGSPLSAPAQTPVVGTSGMVARTPAAYPARLTGELDPHLSRWLWLVKWFLAIPHYIVLAGLWFAFAVTTLVAFFAILFTGRYPRSLFHFNVGVLRWSWRVGFYAYSALGTDRYPPFTLAKTDYPADFEVDYPEHLSHGLVLVKSWLLAIPHLIIVGLLTANIFYWWTTRDDLTSGYQNGGGMSLLGLLVVIAGFFVLISRKYPPALFDLIMGINRWVYRVITYVALMRDEYPPFHLDQGPRDPGTAGLDGPAANTDAAQPTVLNTKGT